MSQIIMKVWLNKGNNQKLITIPKDSDIEPGDYVKIEKVKDGKQLDSNTS